MRNLKYLALVLAVLVSIALPWSAAYADSGSQAGVASERGSGSGGDQSGQGVARPQQFATLTGKLQPVEHGKKRYAIVVGSNYSSLPDNVVIDPFIPPFGPHLNWAENDASSMAGLLGALGFDGVTALVGSGPAGASRANILNAIQSVKRQAKEDDEVVFYFSGHGAQDLQSDHGKGNGNASEGIVTDEGNKVKYLWDTDLDKAFQDFKTDRIVFIFDECLSGGMTELQGPGRLVLSATTKGGISAEDAAPTDPNYIGINHGFFTFFLMSALTGNGAQADALVSALLGVAIHNPYEPAAGATVSMEQAFNFASYNLIAVSPLVRAGLGAYFGPDIAAKWGTPVIIDRAKGDLVL